MRARYALPLLISTAITASALLLISQADNSSSQRLSENSEALGQPSGAGVGSDTTQTPVNHNDQMGVDAVETGTTTTGFPLAQTPAKEQRPEIVESDDPRLTSRLAKVGINAPRVAQSGSATEREARINPTISGAVVDPTGSPVESCVVQVIEAVDLVTNGGDRELLTTVTDSGGRFELELPFVDAAWRLAIEPSGFAPYLRELGTISAPVSVTAKLSVGSTVVGTVVDGSGTPVSNASVKIRGLDKQVVCSEWWVTTDSAGTFVLEHLREGAARLEASADSYTSTSLRIQVQQTGQLDVELRLQQPLKVSGVVVDEEGSPVSQALVQVAGDVQFASTDESGSFTLAATVGSTLVLRKEGYAEQRHMLSAAGGSLEITLRDAVTVRGIVVDATSSTPLGAVRLSVWGPIAPSSTAAPFVGATLSANDGTFAFEGLAKGTYRFQAWNRSHESWLGHIDIPTEEELVIPLEVGESFVGTVTDTNGTPLDNVNVQLVDSSTDTPFTSVTQTETSGAFHIAAVPPGEYEVLIQHADYQRHFAIVRLPQTRAFRATLEKGARLSGRVITESGIPVTTGLVVLQSAPSEPTLQTAVGTDGSYRLDSLPLGHHSLTYQGNRREAATASTPVELRPGQLSECVLHVPAAQ